MSTTVIGSFGRLWGRGHEILTDRRIFEVAGKGATTYLQNLVTSQLLEPPVPPQPERDATVHGVSKRHEQEPPQPVEFSHALRSACLLDSKGRAVSDCLVWKREEDYLLEVPSSAADQVWNHLHQYKLRRSKVTVTDRTDTCRSAVIFGTLASQGAPDGLITALDPRHPSLGLRVLQTDKESLDLSGMLSQAFPETAGNYNLLRRLAGVAEGDEVANRVAVETNQEWLQAVNFHKGCYLGQELTARVHHTGVVRKRVMPLILQDTQSQVPQPWLTARALQEGRAKRKFTAAELAELPTRLPRLSVASVAHLVAVLTGAVEPTGEAVDEAAAAELAQVQERAAEFLDQLQEHCVVGTKLLNPAGKTVGQVVASPVKGTNVALALMRLDAVGLAAGSVWSSTDAIKMGDLQVRALPYLPLWWPDVDVTTGKAKQDDAPDDVAGEAREDTSDPPPKHTRIVLEEVPINETNQ